MVSRAPCEPGLRPIRTAASHPGRTAVTLDIMMPFYGRADHFRLAVESVLAQTDRDWRLVVLDDANPDETPGQWLIGLGDPRIEYVRHPANRGINANFQESLERATAEWVVIFGSDDVMLPGYVARVTQLVRNHPAATMVHPATMVIDGDGKPVRTLVDLMKSVYRPKFSGEILLSGERLATSVTRGNWMNFPAIAWRRAAVSPTGFRAGFEIVQDLALVIDGAMAGGALVLDNTVVFQYRRHSESVSSWQAADGRRFREEARYFAQIGDEFAARGWTTAARAARLHLSSRLNALTRLPQAFRNPESRGTLLRHVFGVGNQLNH
jgi:glycosyltransferase involved in cell wall biosynthesis